MMISDAQIFEIVALVVQFSMTNCLLCVSVGSAQVLTSGSGALNVLLHGDDLRPTEVPLPFIRRPGMEMPLQRGEFGLVTRVEVASTAIKTRDASGRLLRFRVVRATRQGSL
jgi:hypothetical protein